MLRSSLCWRALQYFRPDLECGGKQEIQRGVANSNLAAFAEIDGGLRGPGAGDP